jgi:hypothetical protein
MGYRATDSNYAGQREEWSGKLTHDPHQGQYPPRQPYRGQWPPPQQQPQNPPQQPQSQQAWPPRRIAQPPPDPRGPAPYWPQQQQPPQYPQQQVMPAPWQQPYPPQQWQQPQVAVTRKPITFVEHLFHFFMCFPTCGLWIFVWIARAAAGRTEKTTTYR